MKLWISVFANIFLLTLSFQLQAQENALQSAINLLHQGKIQEALVIIEEVANKNPQDGTIQVTFGYTLLRSGDFDRAKRVLEEALDTSGERTEIHRLLAEIAAHQGEYPLAFEEIEKALVLSPQDKETLILKEKLGKEWKIEEKMDKNIGGNFSVTFEGGGDELGVATLAALEDAYVDLGARFQHWPPAKTEVILYGDRDFKTLTNAPAWVGGLYDGKIRIPVGGLHAMNENFRQILYHEYAHVLIHALARNRAPLWLNEGLAQWAAGEKNTYLATSLAKGKKLIPFSKLEKTFGGLNASEVPLAYAQSLSLTNYLIEQCGEAQILEALRNIGTGIDFIAATADFLSPWGGNIDHFILAWQKTL